jgi:gliding motility-associated-like protein
MKKIIFVLSVFFLFASTTQAQNFIWAQKIGNAKSDKVTCIKTDAAGFVYIAGYFGNSITIGTNNVILNYVNNAYSKEAYVAKLDSTGFCYWAKAGGAYYDDRVLGMDVDAAGNVTITGTYWEGAGIVWGGTTISGSTYGWGDQCFILRLDTNGNILWGNFVCGDVTTPTGGNYPDDQGLDVAMDANGNAYVVGFMTTVTLYCGGNTVTATNPNTGQHKHCYWMAKINSAGVFQWARTFGNLPWDGAYKYIERDIAVCVDEAGNPYVTGGFDSTRHFGPLTFTTYGGYDFFVMKYDVNGNFQWATQGGSTKDDWGNGICSDKHGSIYVTGEHRDSLLMDTILVKNYDKRDAFVIKVDAFTGKPIWGRRAGSALGGERGNDIWADSLCNIYVAGDINEGAKFGDNITAPSGKMEEAFIAKISPEGKWRWLATGGGADSTDRGNAVTKGVGSQVYAAGYFRTSAIYGSTNLVSAGSSDGYFVRLNDSSFNKGYGFDLHAPSNTIFCKGGSGSIPIDEHIFFDYNPKTDCSLSTDGLTFSFFPTTTTTYTLTGIGKGDCPELDTLIFTIVIAPDPVASFNVSPSVAFENAPNFTFTNTSTGASTYQWIYNNAVFSTNQNETKSFNSVGDYCVTLVATSNEGCVDTATHCMSVIKNPSIIFPNAFTPNSDGHNDWYIPIINNVEFSKIKRYKLVIVNRFGEVVFSSLDPSKGWNGEQNGRGCEIGSYYYYCTIELPYKGFQELKGDISLIR